MTPFTARDLCPAHRAEYLRWLDYRLPPAPIQLISIGSRVRDVLDAREMRYRDWRDTIRRQQALIVDSCRDHSRPGVAQPTAGV